MMLMYFGKLNVCTYEAIIIISRKFANCNINVKLVFKTYCPCLLLQYGVHVYPEQTGSCL